MSWGPGLAEVELYLTPQWGGGCIRASAGTDTWVSGERPWGDVADNPRLGVKGWASHLSSANELSLSPSLSLSEKVK